MPFKKGQSGNPKGRPMGSPNKLSIPLRERITEFLVNNFDTIERDFHTLKPIERAKVYRELLHYGLPRLQSISIDMDLEKLSNDQLDTVIHELKKSVGG